jgi:hypothetical protein
MALPVIAMTRRAALRVDSMAVHRIGGALQLRHPSEAVPMHRHANQMATQKEFQIGHDRRLSQLSAESGLPFMLRSMHS